MHRKILALCAALVALGALAVAPSIASAAVTLQETVAGETAKVAVGKKIITTTDPGSVATFSGGFGAIECNENIMTGTVTQNNGTEVRGTIEGAWFQSNLNETGTKCKSPFGAVTVTVPALTNMGGKSHWCIRTVPTKDEWELWGNNCGTEPGTGELTFVLDFSSMTWSYKKTGSVKGTFTTVGSTHEAATLSHEGSEFVTEQTSSSFLCPANGVLKNFKFNMYTDTDAALTSGDEKAFPGNIEDPVFFNPVE